MQTLEIVVRFESGLARFTLTPGSPVIATSGKRANVAAAMPIVEPMTEAWVLAQLAPPPTVALDPEPEVSS